MIKISTTKKYKKLIASLDFVPNKIIKNESDSFVSKGKIKNKKVLLKIYAKKSKNYYITAKREIIVDNLIKSDKDIILLNIIRLDRSGEDNQWIWLVRDYIEGDSLSPEQAYSKIDILLNKYSLIKKEYLNKSDLILEQIITIMNDFSKLNIKLINNVEDKRLLNSRFKKNFQKKDIDNIEKAANISLKEQMSILSESKSCYSSKNLSITISDLNLANIIIDKNCKVYFSDFGQVAIDNYMTDPVFLWLFLWRYPDWQNKIINTFVKNDYDEKCFIVCIIRQILGWYVNIFDKRLINQQNIYLRRKLYLENVWLKYLNASAKGLDNILAISRNGG